MVRRGIRVTLMLLVLGGFSALLLAALAAATFLPDRAHHRQMRRLAARQGWSYRDDINLSLTIPAPSGLESYPGSPRRIHRPRRTKTSPSNGCRNP